MCLRPLLALLPVLRPTKIHLILLSRHCSRCANQTEDSTQRRDAADVHEDLQSNVLSHQHEERGSAASCERAPSTRTRVASICGPGCRRASVAQLVCFNDSDARRLRSSSQSARQRHEDGLRLGTVERSISIAERRLIMPTSRILAYPSRIATSPPQI